MNINVVRVAGASVAALACAVVLSACGSDDTSARVDSSINAAQPLPIPSSGLGYEWMTPDTRITIGGLGDFAVPVQGTHVATVADGVRMHGSKCVLTVKYDESLDSYEASLVLNDDSASLGRMLGDHATITSFLAESLLDCEST